MLRLRARPFFFEKPLNTESASLGWSDFFEGARRQADRPELHPYRITAEQGTTYRIESSTERHLARRPHGPPLCVGDWVLAAPGKGDELAQIEVALARRTELVRQAAGRRTEKQTVAANLDVAFVVTDVGEDFNPRRLERYVAAVRAGGVEAVIVLNKADRAPGTEGRLLRQLDPSWTVVISSAIADIGIDELRAHLGPGRTGGLVGSSGVGKSSLTNALMGVAQQRVDHVAEDGRGRHTTTHRELVRLPDDGGVLIDTPGMRELGLWSGEGVGAVFTDLVALADECRYRDCAHESEPGCALQAAIEAGDLDPGRLRNWRKLERQAAHQSGRQAQLERRQAERAFTKKVRKATAARRKR